MIDKKRFCMSFKKMLAAVCRNHFQVLNEFSGNQLEGQDKQRINEFLEHSLTPAFLLGIDSEIEDVMKSAGLSYSEFFRLVEDSEDRDRVNNWYYEQEFNIDEEDKSDSFQSLG